MKHIFLFFIFFSSAIFAQVTPRQDLASYLSRFKTLSANFNQTVLSADGTRLQKSQGQVKISRPGKFYWQIQKPLAQLIVTNGKTLWIYDQDLDQVTVRKLDQSVGQLPMLLLTHSNVDLSKTFNIKDHAGQFQLIPKSKNAHFREVVLTFKNKILSKMIIVNQLDQQTQIKFENVRLNKTLKPSLFEFMPPKGTDIIS